MMMSRTACCFVALGISFAAFAAACGDDDGGGGTGGNGGNGGNGASGGSAGSAGTAGEGGTAGAAGSGTAGSGTAGSGNAGSGNAGSGNAGSGNAGSVNAGAAGDGSVGGDAGPDSGTGGDVPDSGLVDAGNQGPADSGVNGDCPNFATATAQAAPQDNQPIEIVRVTIDPGGTTATVVVRGNDSVDVGGFTMGDVQLICNGPEDADCVDPSELTTLPAQLALNAEIAIPGVPISDATEGELVLATGSATDPAADTFAYVAWGAAFTSALPSTGGGLSWEARASTNGFWTLLDRIDLTGTQNTFVLGGNTGDASNGDTSKAAGFGVCTADQF
jgi:hypothetical protein